MTKEEILEYFKDINHAYNESTRLDVLSRMLDELMQSNSDEDCISRKDAEMCLTADITGMTIEEYISMVGDRLKGLPSVQPSYTGCDYYDYEAKTCRRSEVPTDDCISRQAVLDKIKEICFSKEQKWVDFRVSQGSNGQRNLIINFIEDLPSVQPKEIYNKGWKDGAEATAYHVELCEKENQTIPMSVIEDIKAEIIDKYMSADGNMGKVSADILKIIDKHTADKRGK